MPSLTSRQRPVDIYEVAEEAGSHPYARKEDIDKLYADIEQAEQLRTTQFQQLHAEIKQFGYTTKDIEQLRDQGQELMLEQGKLWAALRSKALVEDCENVEEQALETEQSDLSMKREATKRWAVSKMVSLDRWGEGEPRAKAAPGAVLTILLGIVLCVYSVFVYVQYQDRPLLQTSDVKWSNSAGPYPLPLTCFFEQCWVSITYDADASGQAGKCVRGIPAEQLGKCIPLKEGESISLSICYSQLPGQGVRMHFRGAPRWGDQALKLGITNSSLTRYGLVTISDMLGMSTEHPVVPFLTPIQSGLVTLTYVRTDNSSLPDESSGATRHEWFSLGLNEDTRDRGIHDPCFSAKETWEATTGTDAHGQTELIMEPSFTHIHVENPEHFLMYFIGSVGGAGATADAAFLVLLIIYYKADALRDRFKSPGLSRSQSGMSEQGGDGIMGSCGSICAALLGFGGGKGKK